MARRDLSYHGAVQEVGQLGALEVGDASGPARRSTTSSPAIASSGSARSRTRSTTTRVTSTARRSRSRSCCAGSVTRFATTISCRCPSRARARESRDAAIDLAVIPVAATRVWRRDHAPDTFRTDAIAHLAMASVLRLAARPLGCARDRRLHHARLRGARRVRTRCADRAPRAAAAVPRTARSRARLRRGVARSTTSRRRERDRSRGDLRHRRRARRAGGASPAARRARPARPSASSSSRSCGTRFTLLALASSPSPSPPSPRGSAGWGCRRTHRLRTFALGTTLVAATSGADRLLRREHGGRHLVRRWRHARAAHGNRGRDHVRRRPEHCGHAARS